MKRPDPEHLIMVIFTAFVAFILTIFIFILVSAYLDRPIVYWSCSQNKCVKVIIKGETYDKC